MQNFNNSSSGPIFFRCGNSILKSLRCGYEILTISYLMNEYLMSAFYVARYYSGSRGYSKEQDKQIPGHVELTF